MYKRSPMTIGQVSTTEGQCPAMSLYDHPGHLPASQNISRCLDLPSLPLIRGVGGEIVCLVVWHSPLRTIVPEQVRTQDPYNYKAVNLPCVIRDMIYVSNKETSVLYFPRTWGFMDCVTLTLSTQKQSQFPRELSPYIFHWWCSSRRAAGPWEVELWSFFENQRWTRRGEQKIDKQEHKIIKTIISDFTKPLQLQWNLHQCAFCNFSIIRNNSINMSQSHWSDVDLSGKTYNKAEMPWYPRICMGQKIKCVIDTDSSGRRNYSNNDAIQQWLAYSHSNQLEWI